MHRISPCPFNTVNGTYPGSQSPPTGHIPLSAVFNLVQVVTPPEVGAQFRTLASVRSLSVCEVRGSRRRMKIMVFWDGETAGSSQNVSRYRCVTIRASQVLPNTKDMENLIHI
jgi:hypothetical protein